MNYNNELFSSYLDVICAGIAAGFMLGFIAWAIGFGIYGITKWIKMS